MEFGEYIEKEKDNRIHPEISDLDIEKGMAAFTLYLDFLEDYMINPKKYSEIPCNTIYPINLN